MFPKVITNKTVLNGLTPALKSFALVKPSATNKAANAMGKPLSNVKSIGKMQGTFTADLSGLPSAIPKGLNSPFYTPKVML